MGTELMSRDRSGFCLQLRLLLWKNYIVKKRHPFVFLLEVFIPLTLFFVFLLIRKNQKAVPIPVHHYKPMPLPSAGIIPVVQSFCNNKNGDDVYSSNNTRLTAFLEQIQTVVSQTGSLFSHLDAGTLDRFVPTVNQSVHDWLKYNQSLSNIPDLPIEDVIKDLPGLKTILQHKYNLNEPEVDALVASSLHLSEAVQNMPAVLGTLSEKGDWQDVLALASSYFLSGASSQDAFKGMVTSSSILREIMCIPGMAQVIIPEQDGDTSGIVNNIIQRLICQSDAESLTNFINDISGFVDERSLLSKVNVDLHSATVDTIDRPATFDMHEMLKFTDSMSAIWNMVWSLPQGVCCAQNITCNGLSCPSATKTPTKQNHTTLEKKYAGLVTYMGLLLPTLCGDEVKVKVNATKKNSTETKQNTGENYFTASQKKNIRILARMLYNNPKILYAPNNTAANRLIQKMNTTFAFYSNVSHYARQWLNTSSSIRSIMLPILTDKLPGNMAPILTKLLDEFDNLACSWLTMTSGLDFDVFRGFGSEADLEYYFLNKQYHDNVTVIAGLVFENLNASSPELPPHFRYKIRQNATLNPSTSQVRNPLYFPSPGSDHLKYYKFGFVWIQDVVERAVIDLQAGSDVTEPGSYLHRMPYPCWLWDSFIWLIQHVFPLCLILSWIYSVSMLVQRIVYEKEKGLKEVMKMMGLTNAVHWCAWFITAFLQMTITVSILTAMLHFGHILPHSDPWIVFIFMELFAISSIAMSFLISSMYSKAKLAAACAGILYMVTYVPYIYVTIQQDLSNIPIPVAVKRGVSIFSTSALGLGAKYFLYYEMDGVGVQWGNLAQSPREGDEFSLRFVLIMMIVDSCLYFTLAWYIENVHPGTYGLPRRWYFPFMTSYWCGGVDDGNYSCTVKQLFGINGKGRLVRNVDNYDDNDDDELLLRSDETDYTEAEDDTLPVGVKVENLTKVYNKNGKPAVNCLSMTLYVNQITSFLGHNGAGKTTTMSLLTGLFPPTSGDAFVNGASIRTDMDKIRQSLGICPQHNVLFESLTVEEHLWFYARLKGMQADDINKETSRMLNDLGINKKKSVQPSCLSGGMQRKLSVAMAFVGGSRTVILDEPTAGVDPYSRRSIWNLLNKYKRGRTILLSTHHMDEAEVLGDRIAIISNGELKCSGSPTFLKTLLGNGQHLHIVKCDSASSDITQKGSDDEILHLIQSLIPETTISSSTPSEVQLLVPVSRTDKVKMAEVLDLLHENAEDLEIESLGVTDTGLEDVFVQITEEALKNDDVDENPSALTSGAAMPTYDSNDLHLYDLNDSDTPTQGDDDDCLIDIGQYELRDSAISDIFCKHLRHFRALLTKRARYALRNRKGIISQILLPAIFVSISMTIALSAPNDTDPPPITISPSQYFNATQPTGNYIPYTYKRAARNKGNITSSSAEALVRTFKMPSGVGATCVLTSPFHSEYDTDMIKHLKPTVRHFELFEKYFNKNCSGVFTPGVTVTDQMFVPSISTLNNKTLSNLKVNQTKERYYPYCECMKDNVGFACSTEGHVAPPSRYVVTRDLLQDISKTDEEDFYLYTTDEYRLHRYGGFAFGEELPYVPEKFGSDKRTRAVLNSLSVKDTLRVRFNAKGYHSMPVYVNTINNAILRANLPESKGNPAAYGITLVNHPMKKTNNLLDDEYIQSGTDVLMAIFIIIAMAFVPASFVVFLVHERAIKAKHLQFISGVHPVVYWISNYLWDMCNYIIPAVCIVAILLAFHIPAYVANGNFQAVVALFLLYGWSITPMMYPASFLFRESSAAYILLIVFNLFTGITCVVCSFMLEQFSFDQELNGVNQVLKKIFLVFPNYCLGNGLMDIALNHYKNEFYSHTGYYDQIRSPMEWDITGRRLVVMAVSGVVFFVITILCEYKFFIKCRSKPAIKQAETTEDDDVNAERERTLYGSGQHDLLRVENLRKVYKTRRKGNVVAVDDLTFSVPRGECFGLLGVNGAGKTTTFKMLTGDIEPTSGDAHLESNSIRKDLGRVQGRLGYCPQFDALYAELTPAEHLRLYARLRGLPNSKETQVVQIALNRLSLQKYADQPAGTLSGGNKRKLSTAISLIGNPSLIFMDEPTTGMDPYSRRFLWDTIKGVVKEGTSVLFTSHSMEECEYLCTRLSIMVNGQLKCLGCKQHLKDKFGDGYTLTVLMTSEQHMTSLAEHLTSEIPRCNFTGRSHRTLLFEVKVDHRYLADIYRVMDLVCQRYDVKDYSLSQNTLDNVFVNFAKHQTSSGDDIDEESEETDDNEGQYESLESALDDMRGVDDEPLIELSPGIRTLEVLC